MAAGAPASIAAPRWPALIATIAARTAMSTARLTALWHDLAHGVLHLDGKIWRTLPLLAWRPGELTRRYIEGERARFVSPMALVPVLGVPDVRGVQLDRRAGRDEHRAGQRRPRPRRNSAPSAQVQTKKLATLKRGPRQARRGAARRPTTIDASIASLENELKILSVTGNMVAGRRPEPPSDDTDRKALNVNSGWPQLDCRGRRRPARIRRCCSTSCRPTPINSPGR